MTCLHMMIRRRQIMIDRYEDYEDFVKDLTRTVPLIKTEQLKLMIANYFSQPLESVDSVMFALQRNEVILMSVDGWSMTTGQYIRLTGDRFMQQRNILNDDVFNRLPKMDRICRDVNRPLSKALWLVADMLPDSKDFIIASQPWAVAFVTEEKKKRPSCLYEITYIAKGYEYNRCEMLKELPKIKSNHVKDGLRRICILDDEGYAFRVPYIGFSYIVVIDHSRENHYRVIEKRGAVERWKDDPYHD